tara:strand:- start:487 stop:654 length:168 start_codon:yes stop_codon:yes gene_type:complete
MKAIKKTISIISMLAFLMAICASTPSCGGKKKGMKVKSNSGMGNQKHKNRHVWGK